MRIHRLLSRKNVYSVGLVYGGAAILFSGLINAPFQAAVANLGSASETAHLYHYHVSAVFATLVSVVILFLGGSIGGQRVFLRSLREAYGQLLLLDLFAVVGGGGLAYAAGWLKEMSDALQGRFFDQADLHADEQGVLVQAGCALVLLLPVHAVAALCMGPVRHWLLRACSPSSTRKHLTKGFEVEAKLLRNSTEVRQQSKCLVRLEHELTHLMAHYEGFPSASRNGTAGQALTQAVVAKSEQSQKILARLAELEAENESLRGELQILHASTRELAQDDVVLDEIRELMQGSQEQALQIRTCRERSSMIVERTLLVLQGEGAEPLGGEAAAGELTDSAAANVEGHDAAEPAPLLQTMKTLPMYDADSRELVELKAELEHRKQYEARMAQTIGDLRAEANKLENVAAMEEALRILQRKVLVVDDEPAILALCEEALTETGLLQVFTADSALAAVERMREMSVLPDLILLDIRMPDLSGTEFCAALERNQKFKHIPVIFCSAYAMEKAPELATLSHVAFLKKPVKLDDLCNAVLNALDIMQLQASAAKSGA